VKDSDYRTGQVREGYESHVCILFCHKITEKISLQEKRYILAHSLRRMSLWSLGSVGQWWGRELWQGLCDGAKCLPHGGQKQKKSERARVQRQNIPFKALFPHQWPQIVLTSCSFLPLLIVYSAINHQWMIDEVRALMTHSPLRGSTSQHYCIGDQAFNTWATSKL
jgi:hypothetical protein